VIPLAYHVDYWNHLVWSAPFSSRQGFEQQSGDAQAMNLSGEYAPQFVIIVRWLVRRFRRLKHCSHGRIRTFSVGPWSHNSPHEGRCPECSNASGRARRADPMHGGNRSAAVTLAIYENGLVSKIDLRENDGRTHIRLYSEKAIVRPSNLRRYRNLRS
jgi:hypothetical protein